ncbi:hypothetical protein [Streptomyces pactum]|uniref:hypothetical protein n=1 Tax=Streptomyces pactum TaxID=68249 RepID=UPI0036FF62F3
MKEVVSAGELCGGALRHSPRAVEEISGYKKFSNKGHDYLETSVEVVEETRKQRSQHSRGLIGARSVCEIPAAGPRSMKLLTDYYHPVELDGNDVLPEGLVYDMGKYATADFTSALLYYTCVSPEVKGSEEDPARIKIRLHVFGRDGKKPSRDALMKVAHSAGLSVARELECENDGGLPEKPVLDGVKAPPPKWKRDFGLVGDPGEGRGGAEGQWPEAAGRG